MPHVIEPPSGLTWGVLVILCETYNVDPSRASPEIMRFPRRSAPIQVGVFPLINKLGMPETAEKFYLDLRREFIVQFDVKQPSSRSASAGTPFCLTIDGNTPEDQAVTVRDRDTGEQRRVALDQVAFFLREQFAPNTG